MRAASGDPTFEWQRRSAHLLSALLDRSSIGGGAKLTGSLGTGDESSQ
jgi:hypothetical protein